MKAGFLLPVLLTLSLQRTAAQTKPADSVAKARTILAIEKNLQDGTATGDKVSYAKYFAADILIVNEDGSRDNKTTFLEKLHPLPKGFSGHINIVNPHLNFRPNLVVLNFVADEYETVYGQQLHTTYGIMDTYALNNGKWQITNLQVYEIPQLPKAISVDKATLNQYCGTYYMLPDVSYTVTLEGGKLYGQRKGRSKDQLFPETNSVFFILADTRGRKMFFKSVNGTWVMHARRNGQDLVWTRK
jgi:hypothetical protein